MHVKVMSCNEEPCRNSHKSAALTTSVDSRVELVKCHHLPAVIFSTVLQLIRLVLVLHTHTVSYKAACCTQSIVLWKLKNTRDRCSAGVGDRPYFSLKILGLEIYSVVLRFGLNQCVSCSPAMIFSVSVWFQSVKHDLYYHLASYYL